MACNDCRKTEKLNMRFLGVLFERLLLGENFSFALTICRICGKIKLYFLKVEESGMKKINYSKYLILFDL